MICYIRKPVVVLFATVVGYFVVVHQAITEASQPALGDILASYPDRGEIQGNVDTFRNDHPADYAAAKADFDLAVRSMLTLEFPRTQEHISHLPANPGTIPLRLIRKREWWMEDIIALRERNQMVAANFYETHLDEMTVQEGPALQAVYADVLLHGWSDWGEWNVPRLEEVRTLHPDLHKYYVLCDIASPRASRQNVSLTGLALEIALDEVREVSVRERAAELVSRVGRFTQNEDILHFCANQLVNTEAALTKSILVQISSSAHDGLPSARQRAFGLEFLDSPVEIVRGMAIEGIGKSIRKPRSGEPPRPEDAELADRLRQIAQSDPSKGVRRMAAKLVREYDTSDVRPTHGRGGGPNSQ